MPDVITLLPDNIANQIAAGEVIQRPASAIKELLENALDAGATKIQLIIQNAGKSLIQVIDNGCGMSETDARMAFERHATSKIRKIEDLFHIRTMGFRGEALASIAAVSQVEIKTRQPENELGTLIEIENSRVNIQEPVACEIGTSIAMKNLFFNVPARRNFLKSNNAELKHIIDEFTRVAMAHPDVFFSFLSNGENIFHLETGSLKQRIVQIMGNHYNAKLVDVKEDTNYMNISGFVGKPDTSRKTRGDQYFFVNHRFIKSPYLHHAVMNAFEGLLPAEHFPMYALFIDLEPSSIDINVHPTKQEIKFEDEKIVYAFVQAAVKHALAQFSIMPSLDFDLDPGIQSLPSINQPFSDKKQEEAKGGSLYSSFTDKHQAHFIESKKSNLKDWQDFFKPSESDDLGALASSIQNKAGEKKSAGIFEFETPAAQHTNNPFGVDFNNILEVTGSYLLARMDNGMMIINPQAAYERITYERFIQNASLQESVSQKCLFPLTIHLSPADSVLLDDLLPELNSLGYLIEEFGKDAFIIQGTPAGVATGNEAAVLESMLEQFKHFTSELKFSKKEKLLRSLAKQHAARLSPQLKDEEKARLLKDLFNCTHPNITPNGMPTYVVFRMTDLDKMFGR